MEGKWKNKGRDERKRKGGRELLTEGRDQDGGRDVDN